RAHFNRHAVWQSYAVLDGRMVIGQNPRAGYAGAANVLKLLTQ
ncbi:type 1 glutamine amidotransferase domain-containing protein, partial [Staphylococcus pseudintermedius]